MSSHWVLDKFPAYRLTKDIVLGFLRGQFNRGGVEYDDSEFDVQVRRPLMQTHIISFNNYMQFAQDDYTSRVPENPLSDVSIENPSACKSDADRVAGAKA